jgi:hypothetical protein
MDNLNFKDVENALEKELHEWNSLHEHDQLNPDDQLRMDIVWWKAKATAQTIEARYMTSLYKYAKEILTTTNKLLK